MRIAVMLSYSDDMLGAVDRLRDFERAGATGVHVAEAYSFDSVSQLGYLAAALPDLELTADILNIYSRTPALLAMTAAGLDYVSGGRFTLGLGSSGPQVIEGFHGVGYDAPIGRTRDVIEICRSVWRRERLEYRSPQVRVPLSAADGGTGLGRPLKLINTPLRERVPIMVAAMGPKNVALTAELAEQWAPFFYQPEGADEVWGAALREGAAKRDPALGPLQIVVPVSVAIGEDIEHYFDQARPQLALYLGGMGARGRNFYNDLAGRYGYTQAASRIQDLYLDGRKDEAAAAIPAELIRSISLIGPRSFVAERISLLAAAGVTTLAVHPFGRTGAEQIANVEALANLL